jgi:hypothetical protein
MEYLTKQQIILLTLLVSFVTSIATGIVTVSLMDQAPVGVTNTINHVIERTIQETGPSANNNNNQANVISSSNSASGNSSSDTPVSQVANAVATARKSLVQIKQITGVDASGKSTSTVTGMGIIVTKNGIVVSDKSAVAVLGNYVAVTPDGHELTFQVIQSQNDGDLVFIQLNTTVTFTPAAISASTLSLGQDVLTLSNSQDLTVNKGIVKRVNMNASSTVDSYLTDLDPSSTLLGSPLFDMSGAIYGLKTLSLQTDASGNSLSSRSETAFYPTSVIKSSIPM